MTRNFFFAKYSVSRTDKPDSLTTRQIRHFFMETYLSLFWINSDFSRSSEVPLCPERPLDYRL